MQAPFASVLQDRLVEGGKAKHVITLEEFSKPQRKEERCRTFSFASSIDSVENKSYLLVQKPRNLRLLVSVAQFKRCLSLT